MQKFISRILNAVGPLNQFSFFIGPNPCNSSNPNHYLPTIDPSAFIGSFSCIIGDVTICKNVYISCNTTIRADIGAPFYISDNCSIEDNVVFHGAKNKYLKVNNINYSIFLGENTTCSHGSVIHGPCILGNNVFVDINATVSNAIIEDYCYISSNSYVSNGVRLHYNTFVPPGSVIDTQDKADILEPVSRCSCEHAKEICKINNELPEAYSKLF